MKKPELDYIKTYFSVTAENIFESDIENAINIENINLLGSFSKEVVKIENGQRYQIQFKFVGSNKWDDVSKILTHFQINKIQIEKLKHYSDINLDIVIVCNVKGKKNSIPEGIKKLISGMDGISIQVRSVAKE